MKTAISLLSLHCVHCAIRAAMETICVFQPIIKHINQLANRSRVTTRCCKGLLFYSPPAIQANALIPKNREPPPERSELRRGQNHHNPIIPAGIRESLPTETAAAAERRRDSEGIASMIHIFAEIRGPHHFTDHNSCATFAPERKGSHGARLSHGRHSRPSFHSVKKPFHHERRCLPSCPIGPSEAGCSITAAPGAPV